MNKDYRKYQRYSVCLNAVLIVRGDKPPEKFTVRVNNISQGGMGFYSGVFVEKSTPVSVELLLDSPEGPDVFDGRIASVSSQENDYFTGIAFDREISYDRFVVLIG